MRDTVTLKIEIPRDKYNKELNYTLDVWLNSTELLMYNCIGYWAKGIRPGKEKIWLLKEHSPECEVTEKEILNAFYIGESLPNGAHLLDRRTAEKAFKELLKRVYNAGASLDGLDYDCTDEDIAIQTIFFGEQKYG